MDNKKEVAVVFGLTKNYAFAVACVMMDLKKYTKNWISKIVIFHDGITDSQQALLGSIFPCNFVEYNFPIKNISKLNQKTMSYFSKMVFSKYECLKLLDDYKNVVWMDYDVVITQDISELTNYCESGIKMIESDSKVADQLFEPISGFNMGLRAVCASTFVFQDHLPGYKEMYKFCYEKLEKYGENMKNGEQAIFDFMIQEFKLCPENIDQNIYSVHPRDLNKFNKAKIIHSYGQDKFWNEINNECWNNNYDRWLAIGGYRYNKKKYLIKKRLKQLVVRVGLYESLKKFLLKIKTK